MESTLFIIGGVLIVCLLFEFFVRRRKRLGRKEMQRVIEEWRAIESKMLTHGDQAIVDADKLFAHVLRLKGFQGSVAEMLRKSESFFPDINNVWSAHKLRNRISHEVGVRIEQKELHRALRAFHKALCDLGIPL